MGVSWEMVNEIGSLHDAMSTRIKNKRLNIYNGEVNEMNISQQTQFFNSFNYWF